MTSCDWLIPARSQWVTEIRPPHCFTLSEYWWNAFADRVAQIWSLLHHFGGQVFGNDKDSGHICVKIAKLRQKTKHDIHFSCSHLRSTRIKCIKCNTHTHTIKTMHSHSATLCKYSTLSYPWISKPESEKILQYTIVSQAPSHLNKPLWNDQANCCINTINHLMNTCQQPLAFCHTIKYCHTFFKATNFLQISLFYN